MLERKISRHQIARHFGVSLGALNKVISRAALSEKRGPRKVAKRPSQRILWTKEEEQYLRENWSSQTKKELAKHFNRPVSSVQSKAWSIGCSEKGTVIKTCLYCGKEFTPVLSNARFCSICCQRGARIKRDHTYRFQLSFRNRVTALIKGKRPMIDTARLLGWNASDFHSHFMNDPYYERWCKNGRDIHVDHIIPLSLYELQDEHDPMLKKAWSLRNLQLLPAVENRGKGDAIPWELIAERDLFDLLPEEYARREEVS